MEIFSEDPIDYQEQATGFENSVKDLTKTCEGFFSKSVVFDKDEFLKTGDQLESLHEDLKGIVVDRGNVDVEDFDAKIIKRNYRSLAIVDLLILRLELHAAANIEDDDLGDEGSIEGGISNDYLELVKFSADEIFTLIETASKSEDYNLLQEITWHGIDIINNVIEDEYERADAIGEVYVLLEEAAYNLANKPVVDLDSKTSMQKLMKEMHDKYSSLIPSAQMVYRKD
jgi:hypothetical protein